MNALSVSSSDRAAIVANYLAEVSTLEYPDICARQQRPWPSLAFGAAGVAYALWRCTDEHQEARLDAAERILRGAATAEGDEYSSADTGELGDYRSMFYYGRPGVAMVTALVALARNDSTTYGRALAGFVADCRASEQTNDELLMGDAGLLNGARILHRYTSDGRLLYAADRLATSLATRAQRSPTGWLSDVQRGFGHGSAGILHALLAWYEYARLPMPPHVLVALASLAESVDHGVPIQSKVHPALERSWCNGTSGFLLLWAKAYECTRDEAYRQLARRTAEHVAKATPIRNGDLCCGCAGRAYALLAMDRIDSNAFWRRRATELADFSAAVMSRSSVFWRDGLYKGLPGLACLHHDLLAERGAPVGFPLIED